MNNFETMGRPLKIESPELLWDLFEEYIDHTDANPWIKKQLITSGDLAGVIMNIPHSVPYSWSSFGVYVANAGYCTRLDEYKSARKGNSYEAFSEVVARISEVMYSQKFNGAAVGAFNQSIISADLGLIQRTITEVKDITDDIDYDSLSPAALEEIANARRSTTK